MDLRSAARILVLAAVVAGVSGASACGPAKTTAASPATSAPTVADSSPPPTDPSAGPSDGTSTEPSSGASTASGACKTSAMTETVYGGDGAAGTISSGIALTNKSSTACSVSGFPTITFVDANGKAYTKVVNHARTPTTKFMVAAGGKAYFTVRLSDVPVNNEKGPCDPPAAGMRISLSSDGSSPLTDKGPWRACGTPQVGPLTAKPDPNVHK